jgi:hypothetical protein
MLYWDLFFLCQILGHRPRLPYAKSLPLGLVEEVSQNAARTDGWTDGCHMQNPCPLVLSRKFLKMLPERMDGRTGAICKILAPWSCRGPFSEHCQNGWMDGRVPWQGKTHVPAFEGMPGSSKRPASDPVSWVVSIGVGVISCPPGITNKSFAFY